jgi:hypothetical protein
MFFRSARDKTGFWGTIGSTPSTIDWCEPNYTQTYYLAEYQNAISSLTITCGGLFGLYWSYRYGHRTSLMALSALIAVVGLGSFLFHGTLLFLPQLLDELPMAWAMTAFYCVYIDICKSVTMTKRQWYEQAQRRSRTDKRLVGVLAAIDNSDDDKKTNSNSNPWTNDPYAHFLCLSPMKPFYYIAHFFHGTIIQRTIGSSAPLALTALNVVLTILHGKFGFVLTFQAFFGIIVVGSACCIWQLPSLFVVPEEGKGASEEDIAIFKRDLTSYRNWAISSITAALIAFTCWLIDNNFCPVLLENKPYVSFHALWHCISYWSTYAGIVLGGYGLEMTSKAAKVDVDHLVQVLELQQTVLTSTKQSQYGPVLKMENVKLTPGSVQEAEFLPVPIIGPMFTGVQHANEYNDIDNIV